MNMTRDKLPFVRLRAMEPEDLDTLYLVENDEEIWNVGTTNVPYSRYVLYDYVANVSGDIYTDKQVRLMIDDEKGETVGMIDLVNFSPQHRRAELSIVIKKDKRHRGYAMAAHKPDKEIRSRHIAYASAVRDSGKGKHRFGGIVP